VFRYKTIKDRNIPKTDLDSYDTDAGDVCEFEGVAGAIFCQEHFSNFVFYHCAKTHVVKNIANYFLLRVILMY
jgi:hypothetical protein